jgi:transcriptional regulator with XRE-family HTH domain
MLNSNIKVLRKLHKLSQETLADELGITSTQLSNYEQGIREPKIEFLIKVAEKFHLSLDVLLRVDLSKTDIHSLINVGTNRILLPVIVDRMGADCIEIVHTQASAGYLSGYGDPEFIEDLPLMSLPFLKNGKFRGFNIIGDSMYPHVKEKDLVVGKFVEKIEDIKNGNTYIVLTKEGLVYKRLENHIKEDNTIHFISDNPLYKPYQVHPEDILELWEYTCLIDTQEKRWQDSVVEILALSLQSLQKEVLEIKEKLAI